MSQYIQLANPVKVSQGISQGIALNGKNTYVVYHRFEEFKITRKNLSIISFLLASRTLVDKSTFLIAEGVFEPKRLVRPLDHMLVASFDQVIPLETNILSLLQMTKLQKCLSKAKFTVIHFQHFF